MSENKTIISLLSLNIYKTLIGIIRSKIIAIKFAVSEMGILGQLITFTNFQNQFVLFGTGAALNSLIGKNSKENQNVILSITISILLISNLVFLILGFSFKNQLAFWLMKSTAYTNYISYVILLGPIYSFYRFLEISVQAKREFKLLAKGQTLTFTLAIMTIIPLTYFMGINGVLLNFAFWYIFGITYFLSKAISQMSFSFPLKNKKLMKEVLGICLADAFRNFFLFAALIIFRIVIAQMLKLEDLGYFQALWSVSNYSNVLVQGFIVFLFPTLSYYANQKDFSKILNEYLQRLILIILPFLLIVAFIPGLILQILFANKYVFLAKELQWIILSKLFEAIYLFYLIAFLSRGMFNYYFFLELLRSILFIIIPLFTVNIYGFWGAILALILINLISFVLLVPLIYHMKIQMNKSSLWIAAKTILGILFAIIIEYYISNIYINTVLFLLVFTLFFGITKYFKIMKVFINDMKNNNSNNR